METSQTPVVLKPPHGVRIRARNSVDLLVTLKETSKRRDLEKGREIHSQAVETGANLDMYVASSLVDMYANCGSMEEAHKVFDSMPFHDVVSWNALMLGYAANGQGETTLDLFMFMQSKGCQPNDRSFVAAVKACTNIAAREIQFEDEKKHLREVAPERGEPPSAARKIQSEHEKKQLRDMTLERGMALHSEALRRKLDTVYVTSCLVDLYCKCHSLFDAHGVFDRMPKPNMVTWTTLMLGYVDQGDGETALELFSRMQSVGCAQDGRCFVAALKACTTLSAKEHPVDLDGKLTKVRSLDIGMCLHSQVTRRRLQSDVFVACATVDMYSKLGCMEYARRVFDQLAHRDVVSWTALICGYADNGQNNEAVEMFKRMASKGYVANSRTYVAVLKACGSLAEEEEKGALKLGFLSLGMEIHSQAARPGYDRNDLFVGNTLIDLYSKCESMIDSRHVFDNMTIRDVVSWNALLLGYAENGESEASLELFVRMLSEGFIPNSLTFLAVVKACHNRSVKEESKKLLQVDGTTKLMKVASLETGMAVHSQAKAHGCESEIMVASCLVDMYVSCGSMEDAHRAFDKIQNQDLVAWTGLISGYAENGEGELALELFSCMKSQGFEPDACTYLAVLKACGGGGDMQTGKALHGGVCRGRIEDNPMVVTGLVDFYGKCGEMSRAQVVFDSSPSNDVVAWTALLAGYGRQGNMRLLFKVFEDMVEDGVKPVKATFACVLTACSHAGLVSKGKEYFADMQVRYEIVADIEHYHCMIDLLGRGNYLGEAVEMVKSMAFKPTVITWITLLSACRQWKNVEVGKLAFDSVVLISKNADVKASAYLLMANIYESLGMWEDKTKILDRMKESNKI